MSKKAETKHAVIVAKAETARMEHLIEGHWRPAVARLEAAVARVRALHAPTPDGMLPMFGTDPGPWCVECSTEPSPVEWPCDTVRALDGAPDPRRVETFEELDALPDRTVIRDADEWVFEKLNYSNDGTAESFWAAPAIHPDSSEADGLEVVLPATVLWLPEVSS